MKKNKGQYWLLVFRLYHPLFMHAKRTSFLVAVFVVSFLVLQYPLITLANRRASVQGIPVLYLYIFAVWLLIIVLLGILLEDKRFK